VSPASARGSDRATAGDVTGSAASTSAACAASTPAARITQSSSPTAASCTASRPLTPAGAVLLERARALLADAEAAAVLVGRTARGELGSVRLGVVGTAMLELLPALVRAVGAAHPDLVLAPAELTGAAQLAQLRAGRLDLGLLHAAAPAPAGIELLALRADRLAIALPADHRLAHRSAVRLVELRDDPLVVMRPEPEADTHRLYVDVCVAAGFTPRIAQQTTSLQALLGFVAAGLGWAFVSAPVVDTLRRGGVRFVTWHGADAVLPTALAWPADSLAPPAALVRQTAAALAG